jgi:hypothetical protein
MEQKENARDAMVTNNVEQPAATKTMTSASEPVLTPTSSASIDSTATSKVNGIGVTNGTDSTKDDKSALTSTTNEDPTNIDKDTLNTITTTTKGKKNLTNPTLKNTKHPHRPVLPEVRINGHRKQLWPSGG